MELVKQKETFKLSDTTVNNWVVSGTVTKEDNGNISIYGNISHEGNHLGNFNYSVNNNRSNINYDMSEENREEFSNYVHDLINQVIVSFNN